MNKITVDPHIQFIVGRIRIDSCLNAIPSVGIQLQPAVPLVHFWRYVICGDFVGAKHTFYLPDANFVIGVRRFLQSENMLVIIVRFITQRLT